MNIVCFIIVVTTLSNISSCSSDQSFRIVNGSVAKVGQFPFTALIMYWNFDNRCTGSVISTRHVITAAHCPYIPDGPTIQYVMAGDINKPEPYQPIQPNDPRQLRVFKKYILHPKYNTAIGWMKIQYDIGIIEVDVPFILTDTLKPLPVARIQVPAYTHCIFPGWGFTRFDGICEQNTELRYRHDKIFPRKACKIKAYTILCGGETFGCPGDCGGAIVCNDTLHGIMTFAIQTENKIRTLYTDLIPHWDWIQKVIQDKYSKYYIAGKKFSRSMRIFPIFYYFSYGKYVNAIS